MMLSLPGLPLLPYKLRASSVDTVASADSGPAALKCRTLYPGAMCWSSSGGRRGGRGVRSNLAVALTPFLNSRVVGSWGADE